MCLIIKTDNPSQLHSGLLETAYENNPDGFGVMFCNNGKLHTHKIVPKTFKDVEKLDDRVAKLDNHFDQASRDIKNIQISTNKITRRSKNIQEVQLGEVDPKTEIEGVASGSKLLSVD